MIFFFCFVFFSYELLGLSFLICILLVFVDFCFCFVGEEFDGLYVLVNLRNFLYIRVVLFFLIILIIVFSDWLILCRYEEGFVRFKCSFDWLQEVELICVIDGLFFLFFLVLDFFG